MALAIVGLFTLIRDGQPRNPFLSIAGSIELPGAQDSYTFTADKDQQVYLDAKECTAGGLLEWTLLAPDDEPVFENENLRSSNSPSDQTVTRPQAGSYRLIVKGNDDATGTYRVKIQSR